MKTLHLIIDGSDNLGKTTVIDMLSKELDLPIIKMPHELHNVDIKNHVEEFSKFFSYVVVQFRKYPFIMDRGFTSSEVYSKVFNRGFYISYTGEIEELLDPKIFIFTGRVKNPETHQFDYTSFCKDKTFNDYEKIKIDKEFCELAKRRKYHLI